MQHNNTYRKFLVRALCASTLFLTAVTFGANMLPIDRQPASASVRDANKASRVSAPLNYTAPQILLNDPEGIKYPGDVEAQVRYPLDGDGPFPVVLYLHGRHVTCSYLGTEFLSSGECELEIPGAVGAPVQVLKSVDSYKGYDYMAQNLAAQGYVVISINANDVNDKDLAGNAGANERSQLILHHLDILREINRTGFYSRLSEPYLLSNLRGKINLDSIGLMGHSRGGQGVTQVLAVNKNRPATFEVGGNIYQPGDAFIAPHHIKAIFALAPTNFDYIAAPDVNFAVLLPYCDGDVSNLQGAFMYDKSRYIEQTIQTPKFQVVTMGANHNFYNTVWSGDDYSNADSHCDLGREGNGRDLPLDQRRHGEFLMSSFFRLFLGNEQQFRDYWSGNAGLPLDACPIEKARTGQRCDDRVHLSIQQPASKRLVIDDVLDAESLMKNNLTGSNTVENLDRFEFCNTTSATGTVASAACPSLRTWATAGQLYLESDNNTSAVKFSIGDKNVKSYDSLTFRAGLPVFDGAEALTSPPVIAVTLSDTHGTSKTLKVSSYSRALYLPPGDAANTEGAKTLLNMVRLPLNAFTGLDFEHIESASIASEGLVKVQLTDLQFQALAGGLVLQSEGDSETPAPENNDGTLDPAENAAGGTNNLANPGGGGALNWLGLIGLAICLAASRRRP
ncbi:MAG TPA: hypothetical protein VFV43_12755 [Limnobacter sp.]|nr:hypothetical protein [Limnobacter sp.]